MVGDDRELAFSGLIPMFNLNVGYTARNLGSHMYGSSVGLPEQADLGWNVELGLKTRVLHHEWKRVSFTLMREADASLIFTSIDSISNGYYTYYARK